MTHKQRVTCLLFFCISFTLSVVSLHAFDLSRLDTTDQALLTELNAPQVIQSLKEKVTADISLTAADVAVLAPILQSAQAKGIPLSVLIYEDWMGQDQMRRLLTIEFKRTFMNGGVAWKYVPSMIDAFLAARDSPPALYLNSKYTYEEKQELLGLEHFLRDTILDNLWHLAYPDESKRPPRSDAGSDGDNAPTLKRMMDRAWLIQPHRFPQRIARF